jgi:hypothetical protein
MAINNFFISDLPKIYNVVQNSMIVYPKELAIAVLRDHFSDDSYYHFSKDAWGFPNTPDHTDLPSEAGINDNVTTRLFIGENYRDNVTYFPAILIKNSGMKSVPIGLSREEGTVKWGIRTFDDGYGNLSFFKNPESLIFAGAWEGTLSIDIIARSTRTRDELIQEVALCFTDLKFKLMHKAGVLCKPLDVSSPTESDDRNGKLFKQTITIPIRTEWKREIPVSNIVQTINFIIEFGYLEVPEPIIAQNLTIRTNIELLDILANLEV